MFFLPLLFSLHLSISLYIFSSFTRDNWKFLHLHFFLYTLFYLFYVLCRTTAYFPAQYTDWTCMQRGKNIEKSHSEEKMKTDKWTGQRNKADKKRRLYQRTSSWLTRELSKREIELLIYFTSLCSVFSCTCFSSIACS